LNWISSFTGGLRPFASSFPEFHDRQQSKSL
jgi:hypothetical protein